MKKLLSILLAVTMLLAMMGVMSGCSGEPAADDSSVADGGKTDDAGKTDDSQDANDSVFPAALNDVEAVAVPNLELTGWTLSGGMVDGTEMDEAQLQAILDACGGMMQFVFISSTNVMLTTNDTFEGTYEVVADGYAVHIQIPNYEYYGVFTKVQGADVMVIANTTDNTTALYFTYLDER